MLEHRKEWFKTLVTRILPQPVVGEVVAGGAEGDQVFQFGFLGTLVFAQGIEVMDVDDLILEMEAAGAEKYELKAES